MRGIHLLSRLSIAIIFFYHGLIPKILCASRQEILMNETLFPMVPERAALLISGYAELAYAVLLMVFYRSRWPVYPALIFSIGATGVLLLVLPELFQDAFNPFSINLAIFVLSLINLKSFPGGVDSGIVFDSSRKGK